MGKSKASRKTVSFQHLADEENGGKSGDNGSSAASVKTKPQFPAMKNKLFAIPIHSIVMIAGLFKFGLTENTADVLLKGIPTLILLLVVSGYLLTQNVVPVSKKKPVANGNTPVPIAKKKKTENVSMLLGGSAIVCLIMSVPIFLVVILFGAPLSSHITETFLLSIHLTFLIFYPLLVYFKMDTAKFSSLFDYDHIYRVIFSNQVLSSSFFTIMGTWFGVFPIPLDWDRPWQQWPITLLTGAYLGSFFGGVLSIVVGALFSDDN